jgi:hypothetical protein
VEVAVAATVAHHPHCSLVDVATYFPASQLVHTDAPAAEYIPAPQAKHAVEAVAPALPKYLPATHA